MKSNEYKIVSIHKLCHTIKNKCDFQWLNGIYKMDQFLKWFSQQLFVFDKNDKYNHIFFAKLELKKNVKYVRK